LWLLPARFAHNSLLHIPFRVRRVSDQETPVSYTYVCSPMVT
jgi:hypothetical protein